MKKNKKICLWGLNITVFEGVSVAKLLLAGTIFSYKENGTVSEKQLTGSYLGDERGETKKENYQELKKIIETVKAVCKSKEEAFLNVNNTIPIIQQVANHKIQFPDEFDGMIGIRTETLDKKGKVVKRNTKEFKI